MINKAYYIEKDAKFKFVKAGVNYNDETQLSLQEKVWREYLTDSTPMGSLFLSNSLFSSLRHKDEIIILHATTSLDSIKTSKRIYCSGGSLGGCVYGTPLRSDGKLHNLMQFILEDELPGFLRHKDNKNLAINLLAIKVKGVNKKTAAIMPINYMDFGEMYSDIFSEMLESKQFTDSQIRLLKNDIYKQLKNSYPLIEALLNIKKLESCSNLEFVKLFEKSLKDTVVLKIAYFETILEYCFLFQNDSRSVEKLQEGELYNFNVKTMVFKLNPKLFKEFNLKYFDVSISEIVKYLNKCSKQKSFIVDYSDKHFLNFFKWRFAHNVRFHFLKGQFVWDNRMSLEDFVKNNKFLAGHTVLRSSKNPYNFETPFAKRLWKKLGKAQTAILTYENLPKGEIGIIPNSRFEYEVYNTTLMNGKVKLTEKLEVTLMKKLISHKQTIMRTHYGTN